MLEWPEFSGCAAISEMEICLGLKCIKSSILEISGATENETIEVLLKFKTDGTIDEYQKKIIIKKTYSNAPKFQLKKPIATNPKEKNISKDDDTLNENIEN